MFSSITFWCEFPERVDWKNLKLPFPARIYAAVPSRLEFEKIKKQAPKSLVLGAWPTLSKKEGYWFSGFCSKESILKLTEFKGIPLKIDIEPPILKKEFSFSMVLQSFWKFMVAKKGKNNDFLKKVIEALGSSSHLIISGLPLPDFLLKRYGDCIRKDVAMRNFFIYKTFASGFLKDILNIYYKWFIKSRLKIYKERAMFAIGCLGPGIFGNEPIYSDINHFEKDLKWFSSLGVKNLVVFNLEGILQKENKEEWLMVLKKYYN